MAINYVKRIPRGNNVSTDEYEQERKRLMDKFSAPLNDESNAFIQSAKRGQTPRTYQGPPPGYYESVNKAAQANPSPAPAEYANDSAQYSAPVANNPAPVDEYAAYSNSVPDNYSQIDYAPYDPYADYSRRVPDNYNQTDYTPPDSLAAYSNEAPDNASQIDYTPYVPSAYSYRDDVPMDRYAMERKLEEERKRKEYENAVRMTLGALY